MQPLLRSLPVFSCLSMFVLTGCIFPENFGDSLTSALSSASASTGVDMTDASTSDGDSNSSSSGGVTTGADETEDFAAVFSPGVADNLIVRTIDVASATCISVGFERLGGMGYFDDTVELPVNWRIAGIWLYPSITDCLEPKGPPNPPVPVQAIGAVGTGMWTTGYCPGPVDIDMTMSFAQKEPWEPASVVVKATGIPVWGC